MTVVVWWQNLGGRENQKDQEFKVSFSDIVSLEATLVCVSPHHKKTKSETHNKQLKTFRKLNISRENWKIERKIAICKNGPK